MLGHTGFTQVPHRYAQGCLVLMSGSVQVVIRQPGLSYLMSWTLPGSGQVARFVLLDVVDTSRQRSGSQILSCLMSWTPSGSNQAGIFGIG